MRPHDTANRVVRIPLHSRKYPDLHAIVDEADAELVSGYRWNVQPGRNTFYAVAFVRLRGMKRPVTIKMHRVILDPSGDRVVDHIDGNGLNNTRANLRAGTHQQNMQNIQSRSSHRDGSSQYLGVSRQRSSKKWRAGIYVNGTQQHLGVFVTEIEAAHAYDRAAIEHLGELASLNFPDLATSYVNDRQGE